MPKIKKFILITGFEPFAEHQTNISQDIANAFAGKITSFKNKDCTYELHWQAEILNVDEQGSSQIANMLKQKPNAFDAIIQCGLCETCTQIHIETKAKNRLHMRVADNAGRKIEDALIIPDGPHELMTSTPLENLNLDSFPYAKTSEDAGAYVCNETYFRSLLTVQAKQLSLPLIFLHLPSAEKMNFADQYKFIESLPEQFLRTR